MTFEERLDRIDQSHARLQRSLELLIKDRQGNEEILRRNEAAMVRLSAFIDRLEKPGPHD